jgi:Outer membrane protein beta-barrel domain
MVGKMVSSLILMAILSTSCFAQSFFSKLFSQDGSRRRSLYERHSDIYFGIGTANYYGDLAPITRPLQSTIQNINWNLSIGFTRHFSPHFSGNVSLIWARLSGDDNKFEGIVGVEQLFMRNAHFRNDVQELAVMGQYNLIAEARSFRNRPKFIPYLFAGIALFHHNPEAKVPIDYAGSEASPGDWVSLQPLRTEGQGLPGYTDQPYSLISVSIPFGFGVKYKLNKKLDLGFETGFRYTYSDYLDDVGGEYADKGDLSSQISNLSATLGHRENEKYAANTGKDREASTRNYYLSKGLIDNSLAYANMSSFPELDANSGGARNSFNKLNDIYLLTNFRIIYHITPSIKCPVIR